jgi:hypothetical protein
VILLQLQSPPIHPPCSVELMTLLGCQSRRLAPAHAYADTTGSQLSQPAAFASQSGVLVLSSYPPVALSGIADFWTGF